MPTTTPGRRAALKERHRQAIVDAAAALMDETGGTQFTVDELAARADIARRTVFNHFASMDDIVTAVFTDVLGDVVEAFVADPDPSGPAAGSTMLEEITAALRGTDLVAPMSYLTRTLGGQPGTAGPMRLDLMLRAFTAMSEALAHAVRRRHPEVAPVDADLLVSALAAGLMAIHRHWHAATDARDDENSRQVWDALVEQLLDRLHGGWASVGTDA